MFHVSSKFSQRVWMLKYFVVLLGAKANVFGRLWISLLCNTLQQSNAETGNEEQCCDKTTT